MNRGSCCVILAMVTGACRHPDPGSAVETSSATGVTTKNTRQETAQVRQGDASGCVVPMEETPAPRASKAAECPLASEPAPVLPRGRVTFVDAPRQPRVEVELAQNDATRQRGLMYRTHMGENEGMLFSWDDESPRAFWMHNTCLPLDMLFIAKNGLITGVLEQVPVLNDSPRGVPCPVAHVLEVNAGWVRAHGVKPGQRITVSE